MIQDSFARQADRISDLGFRIWDLERAREKNLIVNPNSEIWRGWAAPHG
jgi:hypothetical protein